MKKGFTFVALAIGLVIMAMIAGLAVHAGGLVETARVRQNLQKISKMRDAVSILMSRVSTQGSVQELRYVQNEGKNTYTLDISRFVQANLLHESDLEIGDSAVSWQMVRCGLTDGRNAANVSGASICALAPSLSPALLCHIENIMDDQNTTTGRGRLATGTKTFDYAGCNKQSKAFDNNLTYLFRLY